MLCFSVNRLPEVPDRWGSDPYFEDAKMVISTTSLSQSRDVNSAIGSYNLLADSCFALHCVPGLVDDLPRAAVYLVSNAQVCHPG